LTWHADHFDYGRAVARSIWLLAVSGGIALLAWNWRAVAASLAAWCG
jgi:hypothetical protein